MQECRGSSTSLKKRKSEKAQSENKSETMSDHVFARPWSVPVKRGDVPETGRHFDLTPDRAARDAIARLAEVVDLPRLEATFDVAHHGRGGLRVVGHVSATVGQVCVVTVEPIESEIDEPIDLVFLPAAASLPAGQEDGEIEVPAEDEPEVLVNETVDLGAIATEFLVLGVDPYPRKPDAIFEAPAAGDSSARPFAALAALKDKKSHGEG
jgi:uncharacterized metal-binding protein YceD (DUF177 family)